MNDLERRRLRRQFDQSVTHEEDLRVALADWQRELDAADVDFEPRRRELLTAQIVDLKEQLVRAQAEVDELRELVRKHNVPEAEARHPGGGVAALLARDKKPTKWGQGGHIRDRNAGWESPEVPGRRSRR